MAVVIFLSGFLLGLLALALAEGAALLWAVRALRRGRPRPPSPPPEAAAAELSGDRPVPTEKQVRLLVLTLCTFLFLPISLSSLLALQLEAKKKKKRESCRRALFDLYAELKPDRVEFPKYLWLNS
jgi:hypothetical protein